MAASRSQKGLGDKALGDERLFLGLRSPYSIYLRRRIGFWGCGFGLGLEQSVPHRPQFEIFE